MRMTEAIGKIPVPALWLGLAGLVPFWLPLVPMYGAPLMAPDRALLLQMIYAALILPSVAGLVLLLIGFLVQGSWDVQSAQRGELPAWFATLRALLTAGAVIAIVAALAARLMA
jgi:hypothetical protein